MKDEYNPLAWLISFLLLIAISIFVFILAFIPVVNVKTIKKMAEN